MSSSVVQEMSTSSRSALTDGWMDLSMSEIEKKKKKPNLGCPGAYSNKVQAETRVGILDIVSLLAMVRLL